MGREIQCRIKMAGRQNVNVDYLKHTLILSNYRGVPPTQGLILAPSYEMALQNARTRGISRQDDTQKWLKCRAIRLIKG